MGGKLALFLLQGKRNMNTTLIIGKETGSPPSVICVSMQSRREEIR